MKLYRRHDTQEWVGTLALAGKQHDVIDVPTDKPGLLRWLNENTVTMGKATDAEPVEEDGDLDPLERAEMRAVIAARSAPPSPYASPLTARTVLAGIDAGMCAQAISQMDGRNLAKVVGASIERMSQLSFELRSTGSE